MEYTRLKTLIEYELALSDSQQQALAAATSTVAIAEIILQVVGDNYRFDNHLIAAHTLSAALKARIIPEEDYSLGRFIERLPATARVAGCENRLSRMWHCAEVLNGGLLVNTARSLKAIAAWWKTRLLHLDPNAAKNWAWICDALSDPAGPRILHAIKAIMVITEHRQERRARFTGYIPIVWDSIKQT